MDAGAQQRGTVGPGVLNSDEGTPSMGDLEKAVEAADSPYAVIAIAIIGIYVLLWKFGGQLLQVARENNAVAKDARSIAKSAHTEAKQISESIVTNHGSKSLGDAIDRLQEWMLTHLEESRNSDEAHRMLRTEFVKHLVQADGDRNHVHQAISDISDRLDRIESNQSVKEV